MRRLVRLFVIVLGLGTWLPAASAEGITPVIPEANARYSPTQGCVEPTDDMRKNHMKYILHERDETVHEGIRGSRHSLKECIDCHVPRRHGDNKIRASSEEHFCSSCHAYAAVNIDCFQCHSDQPTGVSRRSQGTAHGLASAPDSRNILTFFSDSGSEP